MSGSQGKNPEKLGLVAHAYNPSFSGGREQEVYFSPVIPAMREVK
jgi:hypothetical protein